jgi:hypothetical protein
MLRFGPSVQAHRQVLSPPYRQLCSQKLTTSAAGQNGEFVPNLAVSMRSKHASQKPVLAIELAEHLLFYGRG